jgi:hypothetical protein
MMSGPYTEGWAHENPDDPADRPVTTVQLPHVVVSDELRERAWRAFLTGGAAGERSAVDAAVNAVAGELWQAGFDAGQKTQGEQLSCPQCARYTVSRRTDGKLACPWCGWMS